MMPYELSSLFIIVIICGREQSVIYVLPDFLIHVSLYSEI